MSLLSNLLLLLLSTSLICAVSSVYKADDLASGAGGPNKRANLSDTELLNYIQQWLIAKKIQRGKNETAPSPTASPQQKDRQEVTSQTRTSEQPSKSPLQARLELLIANPNTPPETKSVLKFLLEGNTTQTPFSTPANTPSTHSSENRSGASTLIWPLTCMAVILQGTGNKHLQGSSVSTTVGLHHTRSTEYLLSVNLVWHDLKLQDGSPTVVEIEDWKILGSYPLKNHSYAGEW